MASLEKNPAKPTRAARALARLARGVILALGPAVMATGLMPGSPLAQEMIEVETEVTDFGRIVLTFPDRAPEYTVRSSTGVVVVEFDQSHAVDLGDINQHMPDYIAAARTDPDGGAVRFALANPVEVHTKNAGEQLFIDLLPPNWQGHPPGLPQEVLDRLARRAEEDEARRAARERAERLENAPEVELHIGSLPTLTRFVFDWPDAVDARITREFDRARLTFEDFGKLETRGLLSRLPDYVQAIESENGERGLEVSLGIDPASSVRGFREEHSYVLDVTAPGDGDGDMPAGFPVPESGDLQDMHSLGEVDGTAPAETAPPVSAGNVAVDRHPLEAAPIIPDDAQGHDDDAPADTERPQETAGEAPAPARAGDVAPSDAVRVEARRFGKSVRLIFPFDEETASAIFKNADTLWFVFDTGRPLDVRGLEADLRGIASGIEVSDGDPAKVRVVLERSVLTSAEVEDTSWVITLGEEMIGPPVPIELTRHTGEDGGEPVVTADLPKAGSVHDVRDPGTGERLTVVTSLPPAHGVVKPHRFVDFSVPASVHGLAVRRIADDLRVALRDSRVHISRAGGLTLSDSALVASQRPGQSLADEAARPGFVDIDADGVLDPGIVHRLISRYIREAAQADEARRTDYRLRLARAFLATDMGAEALAQLRLIGREDPAALRRPEVRALRGVAMTLMRRPGEALEEFAGHGLAQSTDVALWRGVAEAQRGNWRAAHDAMRRGEPALATYSPARQRMFGLTAARAALELGAVGDASVRLSRLNDVTAPDDPDVLLLEGRLAEIRGKAEAALGAYARVMEEGAPIPAAEARMRRAILRHQSGRMDDAEAIDRLERLAVLWRGDDIELRTLRYLAGLHVDRGAHRRAFEIMKTATIVDPESPVTRDIQDDMNTAFADLFLHGGAEDMAPLDALTLYYDYRELTPVGRRGDEIIRVLADRLVEVDLLDQAASLLAHQVDNRLSGAQRAEVAAELALVHLLDREPRKALTVLSRTRQAVLPNSISHRRALLEARALSETGRAELALDLLSSLDESPEVSRLRADTHWKAESWQRAGEAYERLVDARWTTGAPLDEAARQDVMRAAIAYALEEDRLGLDRMREKFLGQMAESESARAFDVVTKALPEAGGAFQDVVREIAALDTLDAFLEEYRARYDTAFGESGSGPS